MDTHRYTDMRRDTCTALVLSAALTALHAAQQTVTRSQRQHANHRPGPRQHHHQHPHLDPHLLPKVHDLPQSRLALSLTILSTELKVVGNLFNYS